MFPKILYCFPDSAGESFRPSNGTEGMIFIDAFCCNCIYEKFSHTQCHEDKKCDILNRTMLHDKIEDGYPTEWIYNNEGWPVCTAWKKWDWGNDGDPDDPENPHYRPPAGPNQLVMPFILDEIGVLPKAIEENVYS